MRSWVVIARRGGLPPAVKRRHPEEQYSTRRLCRSTGRRHDRGPCGPRRIAGCRPERWSARFVRDRLRAFYEGPGATVTAASSSRRHGRRFVHVSIDVADVRSLQRLAPFAWSSYRFDRDREVYEFKQAVGAPAGTAVEDVGWDGGELIAFRVHLPSRSRFTTRRPRVERGNILEGKDAHRSPSGHADRHQCRWKRSDSRAHAVVVPDRRSWRRSSVHRHYLVGVRRGRDSDVASCRQRAAGSLNLPAPTA